MTVYRFMAKGSVHKDIHLQQGDIITFDDCDFINISEDQYRNIEPSSRQSLEWERDDPVDSFGRHLYDQLESLCRGEY